MLAEFDNQHALALFAGSVEVVTSEFEHVPISTVRFLEKRVPVRPSSRTLETAGDRFHEKQLFRNLALPTAPYVPVTSLADLQRAVEQQRCPLVLKTRRCGYDGKGQVRIDHPDEAQTAWKSIGAVPCIAEEVIPFDCELSLLAVRGMEGETRY